MVLWEITTLVIVVLIVYFIFQAFKKLFMLLINSVIGFFALFAVKAFILPALDIGFWSVLITAIGGLIGLIAVVLLHVFGVAF